jgi:hypothetical protein
MLERRRSVLGAHPLHDRPDRTGGFDDAYRRRGTTGASPLPALGGCSSCRRARLVVISGTRLKDICRASGRVRTSLSLKPRSVLGDIQEMTPRGRRLIPVTSRHKYSEVASCGRQSIDETGDDDDDANRPPDATPHHRRTVGYVRHLISEPGSPSSAPHLRRAAGRHFRHRSTTVGEQPSAIDHRRAGGLNFLARSFDNEGNAEQCTSRSTTAASFCWRPGDCPGSETGRCAHCARQIHITIAEDRRSMTALWSDPRRHQLAARWTSVQWSD